MASLPKVIASESRFNLWLDNESATIRLLFFSSGLLYMLVGIFYFHFNQHDDLLAIINVACGVGLLGIFFLTFASKGFLKNIRDLVYVAAYIVMTEVISETTYRNYNFNNTIGLLVTFLVVAMVFRKPKQLYAFIGIILAMVFTSTFFFVEHDLNRESVVFVFTIACIITLIALGSKLKLQEKLRHSNDLFKLIFNDSTDSNFLVNLDTFIITDCNNQAVNMFETRSKDDLIGKHVFRLHNSPFSDTELIEIKNQISEYWGLSRQLEYTTLKERNMWGNVEARVVMFQDKPQLLVRINDVTEKKRLEQMLLAEKLVLEMAYKESNLENTCRFLIENLERIAPKMFGAILLSAEENELHWLAAPSLPAKLMKRIPILHINDQSLPIGSAASIRNIVSSENISTGGYSKSLVDPLVQSGYEAITAFPIFSQDNRVLGVYAAFFTEKRKPNETEMEMLERAVNMAGLIIEKDMAIKENKESIEVLRHKNFELEKINSEIDSFVYSTSHDLRAPLLNVAGLVDLADMQTDDAELKMYMALMKESIYKLDDTIKEIIDYYRNKKLDITFSEVDLAKIAQDSFNDFRFIEDARNIDFSVEVENNVSFLSDPKRLQVVLNNLISNAVKFRDRNKSESYVNVRVRITPDHAVLEVEDNGQGIERHHLKRIFDMFYRASAENTGSGLGLYILKEIISKLNGKISVKSEKDTGTTFTLEIPNHKLTKDVRTEVYV